MYNSPVIISDKISIGISACVMGCPVRYNSKGWDLIKNLGREKNDFKWCPVCPECMSGLGVPREPIRIIGQDGSKVWMGEAEVKNRKGKLVTKELIEGSLACLEALNRAGAIAYVYMEGSPSCGVYRTTLKNQRRGKPPGVFGAKLLEKGFFLIPSADLQSPLKWWDWRRRLLAFAWAKDIKLVDKKDLYNIWHKLKFLLQEIDEKWAREKGKMLANMDKRITKDFIDDFKRELLDVLRKPSTTNKITNRLWKNYSYYRKKSGKVVYEINSPEFKRNVTKIATELLKMERVAIETDTLFGSSPVIFREKRE